MNNTATTIFAHGANTTFNVAATNTNSKAVLNIYGGGTGNAINLGDPVLGMQGIQGIVNLVNPFATNTVIVDDSADTVAQTVTLNTLNKSPIPSDPGGIFGQISGLVAPNSAAINYKYVDTQSITIKGGKTAAGVGDTFNVQATGDSTTLDGSVAISDTFNVFTPSNTVAGLKAALTVIGGSGLGNRLIVDDSGAAAAETAVVTASTIAGLSGGAASINYSAAGSFTNGAVCKRHPHQGRLSRQQLCHSRHDGRKHDGSGWQHGRRHL